MILDAPDAEGGFAAPMAKRIRVLLIEEDVVEFVQAGATGFVAKDATIDDLVTTFWRSSPCKTACRLPLTPTAFAPTERSNSFGSPLLRRFSSR